MSVEVITTREDYVVYLIESIDNALQEFDWDAIDEHLEMLKGASPGMYRHVLRTIEPLFSLMGRVPR